MKSKQDGRLAPHIFRPTTNILLNYCFELRFQQQEEFLQTSIPPLISILYVRVYHDFPLKNFGLRVPKTLVEEPFCVSQNFWYRKNLWIGGGGEVGK